MVEHKTNDVQPDDDHQNLSLEAALNGEAPHILAALYKFVHLEDFEALKPKLLAEMINNFPFFCLLQVDEKTICSHQCK